MASEEELSKDLDAPEVASNDEEPAAEEEQGREDVTLQEEEEEQQQQLEEGLAGASSSEQQQQQQQQGNPEQEMEQLGQSDHITEQQQQQVEAPAPAEAAALPADDLGPAVIQYGPGVIDYGEWAARVQATVQQGSCFPRTSMAKDLTFSKPPYVPKAKPYPRADYSHSSGKLLKIAHENELLVKRLTEINQQVPSWAKEARQGPGASVSSSAVNRRKAASAIAQENHALYQRLVALRPSKDISREHLEQEHRAQQKYRTNCSTFKRQQQGSSSGSSSSRAGSKAGGVPSSSAAGGSPAMHSAPGALAAGGAAGAFS